MECFVGFIIIVGFVIVVALVNEHERQKHIKYAWEQYQYALRDLRKDPTSVDNRRKALNLGREYSNLTRNKSGVTVYDEMALKNDIDAACAGVVNVKKDPVEERLARLKNLFESGHITVDEYHRRRQNIIDEV